MKKIIFIILIIFTTLANAQGYRGYYITGHQPRFENYHGIYLVAKQSDMQAYLAYLGRDVNDFLPAARRSVKQVGGQWLWMIDAFSISIREIEKGRRDFDIYVLSHSHATQLGAPFELVKGANGELLIDSAGSYIIAQKEEIINWLWSLDNQDFPPVDFSTNQEILTWISTRNLRTKWELLFDAFEEPYGP